MPGLGLRYQRRSPPGRSTDRSRLRCKRVKKPQDTGHSPPSGEISQLTEHLFRQEAGKLVSVLTGIFGIDRLQLAEDVVQEALIRALQTWPYYGIPNNPAAWLTQTAKNLALDLIRREKLFRDKQPEIVESTEQWSVDSSADDSPLFDTEIKDGDFPGIFLRRLASLFAAGKRSSVVL